MQYICIYIHVLKKKYIYLFELDLCLYKGVITPPHCRDIAPRFCVCFGYQAVMTCLGDDATRFCVRFGYHAVMTYLGDDATSAGFDVGFCRT